ncbi:hypothetical protein ABPG74_009778 [Tetrahymena malaccensis]
MENQNLTDITDFDYLLVLDFEAVFGKANDIDYQEIIEFPVVILDVQNKKIMDNYFQHFIKTQVITELNPQCIEITGITQEQVDNGVILQEAIKQLDIFLKKNQILESKFTFITCGDYDLGKCLMREALYKKINIPDYLKNYINVKKVFPLQYYPKKPKLGDKRLPGMAAMLKGLNLKLEGHHHSGIDDSKNIAKIVLTLMQRGIKFTKEQITYMNY